MMKKKIASLLRKWANRIDSSHKDYPDFDNPMLDMFYSVSASKYEVQLIQSAFSYDARDYGHNMNGELDEYARRKVTSQIAETLLMENFIEFGKEARTVPYPETRITGTLHVAKRKPL